MLGVYKYISCVIAALFTTMLDSGCRAGGLTCLALVDYVFMPTGSSALPVIIIRHMNLSDRPSKLETEKDLWLDELSKMILDKDDTCLYLFLELHTFYNSCSTKRVFIGRLKLESRT